MITPAPCRAVPANSQRWQRCCSGCGLCCQRDRSRLGWRQPGIITDRCWDRGVWPPGWEVMELSPARVAEQRRVQGRRRVKTGAIDLEAITELVLAGHGVPVTARAAAVSCYRIRRSHR